MQDYLVISLSYKGSFLTHCLMLASLQSPRHCTDEIGIPKNTTDRPCYSTGQQRPPE